MPGFSVDLSFVMTFEMHQDGQRSAIAETMRLMRGPVWAKI